MSETKPKDFIRAIIEEDLRSGKHGGNVVTRFPPEPNGYLHIGHAKSICLNFGLAQDYDGRCHLRMDDTDPVKEETHFEDAIKDLVHWLGFDWGEHLYHASDYFDELYELACKLIRMGKAYVDSQSLEEIRENRGTVTQAGKESPYRERSLEENLDLFARMKAGEFKDGEHVLRAKIDMSAANMKMRDPLLYRIRHVAHHRTGDKWCIYPLYDFTHCLSDSFEGITHSICTLEFENNRDIYDWVIETLDMPNKPKQYEFARLNLNYTVLSKRKILQLVDGGHVMGWNDPRLLTLAGLRRRGYTPGAIRDFSTGVGVAKANSVVDMAQLEYAIRNDLNHRAPRVLAVLNPLKVVITNYPEDMVEQLDAPYFPEEIDQEGSRQLPFAREIFVERDDFMENPPKGYFRLSPGAEVRLRYAYIIRCDEVIRGESGEVVELRCSYDEATPVGENPSDGRRVKGTIHWVAAEHSVAIDVRAYDRLFTVDNPGVGEHENYLDYINPDSMIHYPHAVGEASLVGTEAEKHFQFERQGYFVTDRVDSKPDSLVFNRTVTLKDSWAKQKKAPVKKTSKGKLEVPVPKAEARKPEIQLTAKQAEKAKIYQTQYGLPEDYTYILVQDPELRSFFEDAVVECSKGREIANWLINELLRERREGDAPTLPMQPQQLAGLVQAIDEGVISSKQGKEVFAALLDSDKQASDIIEERGLRQITDSAELIPLIESVLEKHPDVVEQIRAGRDNRKGFLVGQIMKATGGKANPKQVNELLAERL